VDDEAQPDDEGEVTGCVCGITYDADAGAGAYWMLDCDLCHRWYATRHAPRATHARHAPRATHARHARALALTATCRIVGRHNELPPTRLGCSRR
jgi:hypothetical protein